MRTWLNLFAVVASLAAFLSGLVLLCAFHVGPGCFRPDALGLSRLLWQNTHRFAALAAIAAYALHIAYHPRPMVDRLHRLLHRKRRAGDLRETLFYLTLTSSCVAGMTAWLIVDGSTPLMGPQHLGPMADPRHRWVDVHHLTGLAALYFAARHIGVHWQALVAPLRRALASGPTNTLDPNHPAELP